MSGRLRLTGELLDSYFDTHRALRPIYVEYEAKFVAGSGKLASWFAAAECFHRPTQAGALWRSGCSQFAKKVDTQLRLIVVLPQVAKRAARVQKRHLGVDFRSPSQVGMRRSIDEFDPAVALLLEQHAELYPKHCYLPHYMKK